MARFLRALIIKEIESCGSPSLRNNHPTEPHVHVFSWSKVCNIQILSFWCHVVLLTLCVHGLWSTETCMFSAATQHVVSNDLLCWDHSPPGSSPKPSEPFKQAPYCDVWEEGRMHGGRQGLEGSWQTDQVRLNWTVWTQRHCLCEKATASVQQKLQSKQHISSKTLSCEGRCF